MSRLIHVNEDVASSLFLALDSDQQHSLSYSIAREWASIDLDRAVEFVTGLMDGVHYSATRGILDLNQTLPIDELRSLANRLGGTNYVQHLVDQNLFKDEAENPAEAWATLSADPDLLTDENWSRIDNIVSAWIKEDGVVVLDTVTEAIEDRNLKERINRRGLDTLVEHHPEEAFDIALQLEFVGNTPFWEPPNNAFKNFVLNAWVRESPMDALNRVLTIGLDSRRNSYIVDVFRSWARSDIQGMVESIPQFPSEIQDSARVSGIFHLSRESIDEALSLFDDIEGDAKKSLAAMSIATSWAEKHPAGALRWAQTKLNTESIRTQVTSTMLMFLAGQDPQEAFDVALRLPINKDGVGLEASGIATLAYTNVDEALEILHKVRRGASQKTAYMIVGRVLAMQGRISEAIELGNELPEEDQVNYYTTVGTTSLSGSLG